MTLEYWKYDAGTDSGALLVIPAALGRVRTFDLDATLHASVPADAADSSHKLSVEVDGWRWWSRWHSSCLQPLPERRCAPHAPALQDR